MASFYHQRAGSKQKFTVSTILVIGGVMPASTIEQNVLTCFLHPNVRVVFGQELPVALVSTDIQGPFFPPWPVAPDILINENTQEFVGLIYIAREEHAQFVASLNTLFGDLACPSISPEVYQFVQATGASTFLSICWATSIADKVLVAQLAEDSWYYADGGNIRSSDIEWNDLLIRSGKSSTANKIVAITIQGVKTILKDFGLVMPINFRLAVQIG